MVESPVTFRRILKYNKKHLPAGSPKGGQFAPKDAMLTEFYNSTKANPFGGNEQVFMHENGGGFGAVSMSPDAGEDALLWLESIRAFGYGKGYGNYMLKKVTDMADKHGVTLKLVAIPYGDKPMTAAKLKAWYRKHGFVGTKYMVRKPVTAP